jgi:hypothetical protein
MWYHKAAVEFLLHHGICEWRDITFSLNATGKVPTQCVSKPLEIMENAWGEDVDMAKFSINSMLGLWSTDAQCVYHVKTSTDPADGHGAWAKRLVTWEGGETFDFIFARKVITNATMRPIHDVIMATEHVRVAQVLFCLSCLKVPKRCIKDIKTDAVIIKGAPKKQKAAIVDLGKLCFQDLPTLRQRFADKGQSFLDSHIEMTPNPSTQEVFRVGPGKPLEGHYQEPRREAQRPVVRAAWRDLTRPSFVWPRPGGCSSLAPQGLENPFGCDSAWGS